MYIGWKMKTKFNALLLAGLLLTAVIGAHAKELLPNNLIDVTSQHGQVLLKRNLNLNSVKLLTHFTTQKTTTYCGIASAVMVLNSTDKIPPADSLHTPYTYFTQDDIFNEQVKTIITPEDVEKKGIRLTKLSQILQNYGVEAKPYFSNELTEKQFKEILTSAISKQEFVIVNFLRKELQQQGGGHHSPIAAYDTQTDRFLLLDVARYKYPSYWVKSKDLWSAVNTRDGASYRGFIVIKP